MLRGVDHHEPLEIIDSGSEKTVGRDSSLEGRHRALHGCWLGNDVTPVMGCRRTRLVFNYVSQNG